MSTIIEKYPDKAALVTAVGDRLIGAITDAVAARGRALIVLTGGGTGIGLLEHVRDNGGAIDWSKVHLFWGDERYVPEDDDERNEKQAREALLDHIDIPAANVHAMPASDGEFGDDLDAAALAYEQVLAANRRRRRARTGFRRPPARHGRRGPHQLAVPAHPGGPRNQLGRWSASPTPPSHRRSESP